MKNFIKNYTLSISFHYLCNQKSDIRLSGKALFHLIRWNNSINQSINSKKFRRLKKLFNTVSNGTKQCKASRR